LPAIMLLLTEARRELPSSILADGESNIARRRYSGPRQRDG
jgi:hypothetical protein